MSNLHSFYSILELLGLSIALVLGSLAVFVGIPLLFLIPLKKRRDKAFLERKVAEDREKLARASREIEGFPAYFKKRREDCLAICQGCGLKFQPLYESEFEEARADFVAAKEAFERKSFDIVSGKISNAKHKACRAVNRAHTDADLEKWIAYLN